MRAKKPYWIGTKPPDGRRWGSAEHACIISDQRTIDALRSMHNRYVQAWNDIELDPQRSLSEHSHKVFGADVVGVDRMFVLVSRSEAYGEWMLEVKYTRDFSPFHPGLSCGKNPLRSNADIVNVRLHWQGDGQLKFNHWLASEAETNRGLAQCPDYRRA